MQWNPTAIDKSTRQVRKNILKNDRYKYAICIKKLLKMYKNEKRKAKRKCCRAISPGGDM